MPIEIVLSEALEGHVADCPNTEALDARVTALEQGGGIETDPVWTADKPFYDTPAAVTQKITNHNIDEAAHGYLVGKVATLQSVIPGTATPDNQLATESEITSLSARIAADGNAITALSSSNAQLNDDLTKHRNTDVFRWNDVYDTQYDLFVSVARAAGLKPETVGAALSAGETYNTSDISDVGGLLKLTAQNVDGTYLWVDIDGEERYSTYELVNGVQVIKYMRLNTNQTINFGGPGTVQFYKWIADEESQIRISMAKMQDEIAENKIMILDLQAGVQNKKPSGTKQDINGQTFTVTNDLGGRITGKGLNLLLGSTGIVTVSNAQGTTEVYNNAGMLSLLDPVPVLVKNVAQGDIVTSSGMGALSYEDYIAG